MAKKRLTWVDAAKGLLMIFVVMGHYPEKLDQPYITFIYWFHMPAFFILSGLFFKPVLKGNRVFPTVKKRFMQLMIPYMFFIFVITALRYCMLLFTHELSWDYMISDISHILFGGRFARGAYGVIWFITTLFTTYILFLLITRYLKPTLQIIALVICYAIAQFEGLYVSEIPGKVAAASQTIVIPWNMDVALLAIVYFGIGYYLKKYIMEIHWLLWTVCTAYICYKMHQTWNEEFDYHLSLKFLSYGSSGEPIYDLLIPFTFVIAILGIIQFITKVVRLRIFEFIEKHSIIIMYFHILVDKFANNYLEYEWLGFTLLGLIVPLIISILFQKFFPYAQFFLGNLKAPKPFERKLYR